MILQKQNLLMYLKQLLTRSLENILWLKSAQVLSKGKILFIIQQKMQMKNLEKSMYYRVENQLKFRNFMPVISVQLPN